MSNEGERKTPNAAKLKGTALLKGGAVGIKGKSWDRDKQDHE